MNWSQIMKKKSELKKEIKSNNEIDIKTEAENQGAAKMNLCSIFQLHYA